MTEEEIAKFALPLSEAERIRREMARDRACAGERIEERPEAATPAWEPPGSTVDHAA